MSTYISTREKIAKSDKGLEEFLAISGYRYETLRDTLDMQVFLFNIFIKFYIRYFISFSTRDKS